MTPEGSRGRRSTDADGSERPDRRTAGDQRRYNRRSPVSEVAPPYYETFDRIAAALERIEAHLARLAPPAPPAPEPEQQGVVPPARASRQR